LVEEVRFLRVAGMQGHVVEREAPWGIMNLRMD